MSPCLLALAAASVVAIGAALLLRRGAAGPPAGESAAAGGAGRSPAASHGVRIVAACCVGACLLTSIFTCTQGARIGTRFPYLYRPHAGRPANEMAAIGRLRTLVTAQALFREGDRDRDGTLDHATSLEQLHRARLIDAALGGGTWQGYTFEILDGDEARWSATARPIRPGRTGYRSFFVDESGVIRFSETGAATSRSAEIEGLRRGR